MGNRETKRCRNQSYIVEAKRPEETGAQSSHEAAIFKSKETFSLEKKGGKPTSEVQLFCGEKSGVGDVGRDDFDPPLV